MMRGQRLRRPLRRRRDRGFSLLIVFLLMITMVGVAGLVANSTQQDLGVSGQERETKQAFFAAEYAIAEAKDFLSTAGFSQTTGWTGLLGAAGNQLCNPAGGTAPGTQPKVAFARKTLYAATAGNIEYNWCLHNNRDDPGYMFPPGGVPNGDTTDDEPAHLLTIEGYGWAPNGATSRITATVGGPTTTSGGGSCYSQEGGCGGHSGSTGATETGVSINAAVTAVTF